MEKIMPKQKEEVVSIPVEKMMISSGTQCRSGGVNGDAAKEFAQSLKDGEKMPPVIVYEDPDPEKAKDGYWIGDGWTRRAAAMAAEVPELPAIVRPGTRFDALCCNASSNLRQTAQRWTLADRRQSVQMILSEPNGAAMSNVAIAELCGVSDDMVADVRAKLEKKTGKPSPQHRVGRDGRVNTGGRPKGSKKSDNGESSSQSKSESRPKPGSQTFDWQAFNAHFGAVCRAPDDIARAYPEEKDGKEYVRAMDFLETAAQIFKRWQERLQKVKAE